MAQLGELCEQIVDCEHKTAPTQEVGYPSIRTPNIGRGYFLLDDVNRVSDDTYRLWTQRAVPQPGDLIMAREAPVGNVAMIPEGLQPCLGQRTHFSFVPTSQRSNRVTSPTSSSAMKCKEDIPSLPDQRRIAGILSAYDDLIENNMRRIRILEEMARALYREWFVHFRFPGHENVPHVTSPLGSIPKGWEVKKLVEFVNTKYGYTESTNAEPVGPQYLRGMDINKNSYIDWSEVPYCPITPEDHASYRLKRGDVVVIRMADPGKVGIVEQEVDAVFASYLIRVAQVPFSHGRVQIA